MRFFIFSQYWRFYMDVSFVAELKFVSKQEALGHFFLTTPDQTHRCANPLG